ncbi:MAG: anion transporter [Desulfobacteraceae bacterium]|nr:MAG: anion transporter [Desulfobacteraceae bacterium]
MGIPIIVLGIVFLLTAFRQVGKVKLQIWQVMLGGAVIVLVTGRITPIDALHAINFDVLFFLFGMFIIGQATEDSGYLTHLCHRLFGKVRSVDGLVLAVLFTMGLGSAVLMNDTIAIIGTPVMLMLSKRNHISSKLLLLCLAFAITIGSVVSPIGNPQNLLVAINGNIKNPFITYAGYLLIPTVINLFFAYLFLKLFYGKEFATRMLETDGEHIQHRRLANTAKISLILVTGLILLRVALTLLKLDFDFKLTYIALIGCAPVLIYRFFWKKKRFHILRRIDWFTLLFFASMFVLMESVWKTGFFQGLITRLQLDITSTAIILMISVAVSQLISNVPMVALFLPLLLTAGPGVEGLMALSAGSTIAGNLFILGAASNVIIIQHAEKLNGGESVTFTEFAAVGLPLTAVNIAVYWVFLGLG